MRGILIVVLAVHGAIHLIGFAKGSGLAEISQLRNPVGPKEGIAWLVAAILLVGAAATLWAGARWWWWPALGGIVLSQVLIFGAWGDARFGTIANVVLLLPVALAALDARPSSVRSTFEREVARALGRADEDARVVTADDLHRLPAPVRVYLQRVGVVGQARVKNLHATFKAKIRGGPDDAWMDGPAEQYETFDPPERLFFMKARRAGLPVHVFHRYGEGGATMEARIFGLFTVLNASGPQMARSETVTFLNDVFFLAPAALVDLPIGWEVLDPSRVRATFTNAGHTVSAVIRFDEEGDLVDFESSDRYQMERDPPQRSRWSTPFFDPGGFGPIRLPAGGEALWGEPGEEWRYADFRLRSIRYNVAPPARGRCFSPAAPPPA
jgi:hypothetical protein